MKDLEIKFSKNFQKLLDDGPTDPALLSYFALCKYMNNDFFKKYEMDIIIVMGLFFKKNLEYGSSALSSIFSIFDDGIFDKYQKNYTPMQADIRDNLTDNKRVMFSAPTSVGKSFLLRDIILSSKENIVIIVPTRALINEYILDIRSTLLKNANRKTSVCSFIELVNTKNSENYIFIVTPERCMEIFSKNINVGMFVFDEAQLIDKTEKVRGYKYKLLIEKINKIHPDSKKLFAYPFVENLKEIKENIFSENEDCKINKYNYYNIGQIFIEQTDAGKFRTINFDNKSEPTYLDVDPVEKGIIEGKRVLIYCTKAKIYRGEIYTKMQNYIKFCKDVTDLDALRIIEEVKNELGSTDSVVSKIVEYMKKGIAIHHGSLPNTVRLLIEEFARKKYATICIATTTLEQGVNLPFDIIYLYELKNLHTGLDLKNLIGRAGRSTLEPVFDYGIVVTKNKKTFLEKYTKDIKVDIDKQIKLGEDYEDYEHALKNDDFDYELGLPKTFINKLDAEHVYINVKIIIENIVSAEENVININSNSKVFEKVKNAFMNIFRIQLKNQRDLTESEQRVFTTAIRILIWKLSKQKFAQTVMQRFIFSTKDGRKDKDNPFLVKYEEIPDKNMITRNVFYQIPEKEYYFDLVVYDTYEYVDKCINLYLKDIFIAAIMNYSKIYNDNKAIALISILKYGSNNNTEILLFKYGFEDEEIEKLISCIKFISEEEIEFNDNVYLLEEKLLEKAKFYIK